MRTKSVVVSWHPHRHAVIGKISPVPLRVDVEQSQDQRLSVIEFVLILLNYGGVFVYLVGKNHLECIEHFRGGGVPSIPFLGVDFEPRELLCFHFVAHLTLQERLNHQRDKEQKQAGFDTLDVLEQQGRGVMNVLERCEMLLESGLILVGLQDRLGREI